MLALLIILKIILKILIDVLLIIAGLTLLLIIIPFNYSGQILTADGLTVKLTLGWAWRLLGINAEIEGEDVDITLRLFNKRVYKLKSKDAGEKKKQPQRKPDKKEKEKKGRKGFSLKDISDRALVNEVLEYFKRVLNIAKPKYFHLYGTYGFDDPSLTGIVYGISGIIRSIIPNAKLNLTPDFDQKVMDLDLRAEGSMTMGSLAYQTARTALKKPVRKVLFRKKKS